MIQDLFSFVSRIFHRQDCSLGSCISKSCPALFQGILSWHIDVHRSLGAKHPYQNSSSCKLRRKSALDTCLYTQCIYPGLHSSVPLTKIHHTPAIHRKIRSICYGFFSSLLPRDKLHYKGRVFHMCRNYRNYWRFSVAYYCYPFPASRADTVLPDLI
jgi:hypothetical protein